ncbi:Efflux pump membrane transporter BepE [Comamonas aquatica]|nr:Efflux pump membrane transporter BepE [Comamonas aquatica]CAC9223124.1 Efflux pump membrane transporter BepE [Comamonas aquatica]
MGRARRLAGGTGLGGSLGAWAAGLGFGDLPPPCCGRAPAWGTSCGLADFDCVRTWADGTRPQLVSLISRAYLTCDRHLCNNAERVLGGFFRRFNTLFRRGSDAYSGGVQRVIGRKALMLVIYAVLVGATWGLFKLVPGGFVPAQDKQYLVGFAQLPDGATLDRTEDVIRRMGEIVKNNPNVEDAIAFPGLSINGFTNSSNSGIVFVTLKPFAERTHADQSGGAVAGQLNQAFGSIQEAFIAMFPPPPVAGLGTTGGFKLQIEDRASLGYDAMDAAVKAFMAKAYQTPELAGLFTSWQVNVPQLYAAIDRTRARQLGVPVTDNPAVFLKFCSRPRHTHKRCGRCQTHDRHRGWGAITSADASSTQVLVTAL